MEIYTQTHDCKVFGSLVPGFPAGIEAAFIALIELLRGDKDRAYYGISWGDGKGGIHYRAMTAEKFPGEAQQYGLETAIIQQGAYLIEPVTGWRKKTACIKDVCHLIIEDERSDKTMPCIEWYKNDDEMVCMVKINPAIGVLDAIKEASTRLLDALLPLTETQLNTIPFEDSWTAAQLADHITKSNKAMEQAMEMEGKPTHRDPAARAAELRNTFLDFSIRFKSPEFILPTQRQYEKAPLIGALQKSNTRLQEVVPTINAAGMINLPAFGEITKLELLYFGLYHTQRHIRQLTGMLPHVKSLSKAN
ncbi:MAG: DinB family protein [Bacteroidota bacterium]